MRRTLYFLPLMILLAGCSAPTLYTWGDYEPLIYASYSAPGKVPAELQIERLEHDYQKARATNKRMPPGWHAHLGYLYYHIGRLDQANQEFLTEKAEFPESTILMDRLMANLKKQ